MIFAPGAQTPDLVAALAEPAIASLHKAGAPVVAARAETGAVVAMNGAAAALFGATLDEVSQRLFAGSEPGARRVAALAQALQPGAAPRLERLRFYFGPVAETVTLVCQRVAVSPGATLLILGAPGMRASTVPSAALSQTTPPPVTPLPVTPPVAHATPAAQPALRFVWRTDRDGRLLDVQPPFGSRLSSPVHVTGRLMMEVLADAGADRDGHLKRALASHATFAGVSVDWPDRTGAPTRVLFGAMPRLDAHRQFGGFRGYALIEHADDVGTAVSEGDEAMPEDIEPEEASQARTFDNVVQLRSPVATPTDAGTAAGSPKLSAGERSNFDEIARVLAVGLSDAVSDGPSAPLNVSPHRSDEGAGEANRDGSSDLRRLIDLVPVGMLVCRGGEAIFANRTLLDLLGYPTVERLQAAGGLDRMFGGVTDSASDDPVTLTLTAVDGEIIPVDARVHATAWEGSAATLVSMRRAVDATAAGRAQTLDRTLRERDVETQELHTILDTATDGVVILDGEGAILSLNRAAEALFGRDDSETKGRSLESFLADDSRLLLHDYLAGLKAGGVASVLNDGRELLYREPRGGTIPIYVTIGRLGEADAPRFCAVLRDLTAWKKAEQNLEQARQAAEHASAQKSEFLARISHEIRTPLNAILGFAEVIMDERFGPVGNERYREYLKDIHRSGEHVMSLVNDLLDLSKIEAGKMDMTFTAVDANSCVSDCVALMQPQASRARVVIRLSLAPRLPKIVADDRAFKQIVLNILSNAVKYNEAGGQVIVSTARTDAGNAVIRIRDTGIGMSDAEVQTALAPFGQINTSRQTTGTGLGLPLTKALAEANRAGFTIRSRKGEGTLVEVSFPPSRVMAD